MELKAVKTLSTEMVEPAEEIDKTKYELSAFDRLMRYAPYQKRILFYKEHASDLSDLVTNLKRSLARVLVAFPPLAGRMRCGDGVSSPVLEIDCTGELGVQFTEAETDTTIEVLGDCEPSEFCDSLCDVGNPPPQHPWKGNHPLIFVQVTKFGCGGLTVGVAFSHQAMDGVSAWKFINSWAEVARTGTSSIFKTAQQFYGFKHLNLRDDDEFFDAAAAAGFKKRDDVDELPQRSFGVEKPELRTKLYKMDKFAIEKLKEEAGVSKEGRKFSTYVVLCAHFWRKVTVARSLRSLSNFLVLVNVRDKIKSVPHTYFGNAVTSCFITATVEELVEKPLSHAASLLHEAIRDFDSDKAVNAVAFLDKCVESGQKLKGFAIDPMMMVVSSPKHPVYENDFGFGRPIGATFGANDLHEGKLYLFPSADGAGVDATVVLPPDGLQRLLNDPSVVV